jgi:hypothetical protein
MTISANLADIAREKTLRLLCRWSHTNFTDEITRTVIVPDVAAADRELESFVEFYPGHEISRTGDGWASHE